MKRLSLLIIAFSVLLTGCSSAAGNVHFEEITDSDRVYAMEVKEAIAESERAAEESRIEESLAIIEESKRAEEESERARIEAEEAAKRVDMEGKYVSILGDDCSTYEGFIADNLKTYYEAGRTLKSVDQTWWKQVLDRKGGMLLSNVSFEGNSVTRSCNEKKYVSALSSGGVDPDVIIIYLGMNDFLKAVNTSAFSKSYNSLLSLVKKSYPQAEIICLQMQRPATGRQELLVNWQYAQYFNSKIAERAVSAGCRTINLYDNCEITPEYSSKSTIDGIHPNVAGMEAISECILKEI